MIPKCTLPWSHQANCQHADGNGNCEADLKDMCPQVRDKVLLPPETPTPGEPMLIRSPGGEGSEIPLAEVQIPDLWHISSWLKDLDECRTKHYPHTRHALIHGSLIASGFSVLETWHLCHDLLNHAKAAADLPHKRR